LSVVSSLTIRLCYIFYLLPFYFSLHIVRFPLKPKNA